MGILKDGEAAAYGSRGAWSYFNYHQVGKVRQV